MAEIAFAIALAGIVRPQGLPWSRASSRPGLPWSVIPGTEPPWAIDGNKA